MSTDELCFSTARDLAARIRRRDVSCVEVMRAHLDQIERVNPRVNAIVTLAAERALDRARAADVAVARGDALGPLHGLPIAHKDLVDTAGMRTTYGSPIYADHVPARDALIVERLRRAGAIAVGKTNTPEFGAGSQTFNTVFGATLNPYDTTRTCGGSSGGAAVALACGMVPLADGSDLGGSLRNPAAFCNVVGLRPSPGRVPEWPAVDVWNSMSVDGPMARTVGDVALMLSAIAGPDPRAPLSIDQPGASFAAPLERDFAGARVAWLSELAGMPVEPAVRAAVDAQRPVFEALGCVVETAGPDLSGADEVFRTLRAVMFLAARRDDYAAHRDKLKDTIVWNYEHGLRLTAEQIATATIGRTALFERVLAFFDEYDYLALPVTQVAPFDVNQPYVTEINGAKLSTYLDWMRSCYLISATSHPAISVPCGFTDAGLPVGLQIVGRYRGEWGVLQLAHAFEQATGYGRRRPPVSAR